MLLGFIFVCLFPTLPLLTYLAYYFRISSTTCLISATATVTFSMWATASLRGAT